MLPKVHSTNMVPPHGQTCGWHCPVIVRHDCQSDLDAKGHQLTVVGLGAIRCASKCTQWLCWTDRNACQEKTPGKGYHQLKNVPDRILGMLLKANCLFAS